MYKAACNCEEWNSWEDGYRQNLKSKVKNTLLGGEILPSGCTQVTRNIYSIEGGVNVAD